MRRTFARFGAELLDARGLLLARVEAGEAGGLVFGGFVPAVRGAAQGGEKLVRLDEAGAEAEGGAQGGFGAWQITLAEQCAGEDEVGAGHRELARDGGERGFDGLLGALLVQVTNREAEVGVGVVGGKRGEASAGFLRGGPAAHLDQRVAELPPESRLAARGFARFFQPRERARRVTALEGDLRPQ